ncbi:unnamed protein product [Angiostrongylus costaricensis]|uniref:Protein polybromo-1 n=1 Tax=Angiostrongylus costaricensis TaxID=334426 RepID=A0A158PJY3_ANGCS|nr:unnamed protein product [Angiostrongylus costaricensis]
MSTKRKRSEDAAENSPSDGTPALKRRRGRITAKEKERISQELYNAVKISEIAIVCFFLMLGCSRAEPDYYKQVKSPIDFTRIQQKLKTEEYQSFEEFCEDFELLVDNTRNYYKEESEEYKAAIELLEIYRDAKEKIRKGEPLDASYEDPSGSDSDTPSGSTSSRASSSASSDELDNEMVEDILCGILELTDSTGRLISPPFRVLQSKEEFPVYYEKICHPMDLKTIAEKTRAGAYTRMSQVERDVRVLCRNAQQFSGKGSEIYKDAVALMNYFKGKSVQVLERGVHPKRREKIRRIVDGLLAQTALPSTAELSEDSEEDEDTEESDDPFWKLYWTIRNAPNDKDREANLSDPFLELPSRSYYPDYFDEISRPVSLFMINRKLKRNGYKTFDELLKDFIQMFENACEYNMETSDIFIAAQKLQNLAIRKARELQPSLDLSLYSKKCKYPSKSMKFPKNYKVDIDSDSDEKDTSVSSEKKRYRSTKKLRSISTGMNAEHVSLPGRPGRKSMDELMLRFRQKLMIFWDLIFNHKVGTYWPAGAFMELPSSREYPDYYRVIERPIDLKTIKEKIENNKVMFLDYEALMEEFTVLFDNARRYNEADSQISRDAGTLLSMVNIAHADDKDAPYESPLALKIQKLLKSYLTLFVSHYVFNYGIVFGKNYVHFFFVIMTVIYRLPTNEQQMWKLFHVVRDATDTDGRKLASAFIKLPTKEEYPDYYEVIRKPMDLQRIQQRLQAHGYGRWVDIVADMCLMLENACKYNEPESNIYKASLLSLFYTAAPSFGEETCDSFAELPELLKARCIPPDEWPFSFDQIKRNIDKGRYRRLDRFQKDFFDLFDRARELSRSDSKLFEDATELQLAFVKERDIQCKGVLISTAFATNENDGEVDLDSLTFDGVEYNTPSYAYITRTDDNARAPPHIIRIERIFKTDSGDMMVRGKWVYRPNETLHLANRKFIENEVFVTPFIDTVLAERLCGKCVVMSLKTAINNVVEDINPKDVYVCECRYLGKPRYFAKLKTWPFPEEEEKLKLSPRSRPLSPVRVMSEFMQADGVTHREDDEIPSRSEADADGRTYFHAMRTHSGKHHSVGQFVLVFNPQKPTCDVMRIDKLWREKDGSEWFSGGWLARPTEVQHDCGRTFFVREVFAIDQPDQTRRIEDIQSHCFVKGCAFNITSQRPTEIPECDVFVCESRVPGNSFAKGEASSLFTRPPEKVCLLQGFSVQSNKFTLLQPISIMSNWLAAQPKLTAKSKSGYILFSAEIRKRIMHENPDSGFGEVSKIVGIEWKKLSDDQKRQYEVRAEYIASERAKQEAARAASEKSLQPGQIRIYQCRWINCDSQFDSENGLYEHIVQHHTSQIIMDSEQQYVCMWVTCVRNRKEGKPFPSLPRLHRHMKEKHLSSSVKSVYPNQIGRNFFKFSTQSTSTGETIQSPMQQHQQPTSAQIPQQIAHHQATPSCSQTPMVGVITDAARTVVKAQTAEPVFVAPPSSVHARRLCCISSSYIESLSSNRQRSVSKWDTSLSTNARNAQPNAARPPPTHWIRESRGRPITKEEDVVRALWRLRDELLESTCNLSVEKEFVGVL